MDTKFGLSETEQKEITDLVDAEEHAAQMYGNHTNVGTEEMSTQDVNTPILKIVQKTTSDVENHVEGKLYRTDTATQYDHVDVNFVYVTSIEMENYNKTAVEKVKMYYGFYAGTNEPFRLYVRGWSVSAHRNLQSYIAMYKAKYHIPMLALTVRVSTEKQEGTIKDTGKPYSVYMLHFEILKAPQDKNGVMPLIEMNADRIGFLMQTVDRFKESALVQSENDKRQSETEG